MNRLIDKPSPMPIINRAIELAEGERHTLRSALGTAISEATDHSFVNDISAAVGATLLDRGLHFAYEFDRHASREEVVMFLREARYRVGMKRCLDVANAKHNGGASHDQKP